MLVHVLMGPTKLPPLSVHPALPCGQSQPAAHPEFYAAHSRRWWVCLVFSTLGLVSGASWNIYSPISTAVTAAYGWDGEVLAWLPALGGIALTVCVLPAAGCVRLRVRNAESNTRPVTRCGGTA